MALDFDVTPYFDDFEAANGAKNNNYMRILFRPDGYAVQARELTQLQSIIQNQLKNLGGFIFQEGSPVYGGHISLDTTVQAIQLNPQITVNGVSTDINLTDFFVNGSPTLITNASGPVTVKAVVVGIDSSQINPVIVVKYLTGNQFTPGSTIQVASGVQSQAQLVATNASNPASTASIDFGIFYSGGFFVQVNPQTIVLDSTTSTPTYRVGLQIQESIIDEVTDTALLDPALGSSNYQAPGATRYQYLLSLSKRTLTSTDDSAFYELLRVENGLITKQIDYPVFADLDKSLAMRTYDQAGNFTVKPFVITVDNNLANSSQYTIVAEPGKAYVKGFQFETIGTQRLFGDKALTTNTVNAYGMSLEFGNILTTANLYSGNQGTFDIGNFQSVDLHIVPVANINSNSSVIYSNSKIGTARVRDIEFLGLGQFYTYVTDVSMSQGTFIANNGTANTTTTVNANSSLFTPSANAYANVRITVNSGGIIDSRRILSSTVTSGNLVFTLDVPTSVNVTSTSNCTLWYAAKDIESVTVTPGAFTLNVTGNVYYSQNSIAAIYPCMDIAVSGRNITGNTVLSDTQFNKLLYPLPQSYIAQNSFVNASFYHRKELLAQQFTTAAPYANLAITSGSGLGTGESFPYGFTATNLPDNTANTNFIIIVKDKQASNLSNGQVINFNRGTVASGNGVYQQDSTHATLSVGASNGFIGDIYLTVKVTNAATAAVARRSKSVVGNSSVTTLRTTDSYLNGTVVTGNTTTYIDTSNGFVWFINNAAIPTSPGSNLSLYVPDVYNIIKIYDSGNNSYAPNVSNTLYDLTSNYYLDSGQRDNYYDHAKLVLKPGANPPAGQTVVMLQYFAHDSVLGFFDADSYSSNLYSLGQIPYYRSPTFGTISLRDSIDFRPTRNVGTTSNVSSFTLYGLSLPQPDNSFQTGYSYYLSRIDKLQLTKDKYFRIKKGNPAQFPVPPADSDDAMTLYVLTIPAYTANVKQIQIQYIENKRYTMRDIGGLDSRIQQLEYYSSLSQLETQATNENILYQDNVTAKDQYGIIADDFGSFSVIDNLNTDLLCFLEQGSCGPFKAQNYLNLNFVSATSGYSLNDKTYSLQFTETPAITQPCATSYISVQPFLFAQFKGRLKLTPETDSYYSLSLPPQVSSPSVSLASDTPPAASPVAASTLINANTPATPTTTIMGSLVSYGSPTPYVYVPIQYAGGYALTTYRNVLGGYGYINPVDNWYGVANGKKLVPISATQPNLGNSIQLNSSQVSQQQGTISTIVSGGKVIPSSGLLL